MLGFNKPPEILIRAQVWELLLCGKAVHGSSLMNEVESLSDSLGLCEGTSDFPAPLLMTESRMFLVLTDDLWTLGKEPDWSTATWQWREKDSYNCILSSGEEEMPTRKAMMRPRGNSWIWLMGCSTQLRVKRPAGGTLWVLTYKVLVLGGWDSDTI